MDIPEAAQSDAEGSPFLELPPKIRLLIYAYVPLTRSLHFHCSGEKFSRQDRCIDGQEAAHTLASILCANRFIHKEAAPIFYDSLHALITPLKQCRGFTHGLAYPLSILAPVVNLELCCFSFSNQTTAEAIMFFADTIQTMYMAMGSFEGAKRLKVVFHDIPCAGFMGTTKNPCIRRLNADADGMEAVSAALRSSGFKGDFKVSVQRILADAEEPFDFERPDEAKALEETFNGLPRALDPRLPQDAKLIDGLKVQQDQCQQS